MSAERLRIGAVAARAGVNVQTLRYYERRGLLREPSRTTSGYREYLDETVLIVRFIKRAQDLGFTLAEVQDLLRLRESRTRAPREVRVVAEAKIRDIEEKVRRLRSMLRALGKLVESCKCKGSQLECPILEALDDHERTSQPGRTTSSGRRVKDWRAR